MILCLDSEKKETRKRSMFETLSFWEKKEKKTKENKIMNVRAILERRRELR